jgi:serine/threonine protein kinase
MTEQSKTLASFTRSRRDSAPETSESCLSDDEILAFVRGQLTPDRSDNVHVHLDCCSVCQRLMSEAAHALDPEPFANNDHPSWNTVFQSGSTIAKRYRIVRLVGQGGMGQVFEVHDMALHERVALKTVTATHCDNVEAVRLLKAEVQLARRISHPNVCRIFDLGSHQIEPSGSEISFLVMEYVDGECLGKKLRQDGALPLDMALSIAHELLQGLSAAHGSGIVHRDFKSDNVMLQKKGSSGRVKAVILDFGLAKVLGETGSIVTTHSHQAQAMIGTVGYMAPEQIEGQPVTAASDIYAFGVVWFEMLTGRLPFEAETLAASAMSRLHRLPKPPSHYNDNVPKWLDDIVLKCLGRYPANRFASAEQVIIALAANTELSLRSTSPSRRKTQARLRLGMGLLTLVVLPIVLVAASQNNRWSSKINQTKAKIAGPPPVVSAGIVPELKETVVAVEDSSPPQRPAEAGRGKRAPSGTTKQPRPSAAAKKAASSEPPVEQPQTNALTRHEEPAASSNDPDWEPLGANKTPSEAQLKSN